jgi:hypothetical protein
LGLGHDLEKVVSLESQSLDLPMSDGADWLGSRIPIKVERFKSRAYVVPV